MKLYIHGNTNVFVSPITMYYGLVTESILSITRLIFFFISNWIKRTD